MIFDKYFKGINVEEVIKEMKRLGIKKIKTKDYDIELK